MDPDKVQGDSQKMLEASTFLETVSHHSSARGVGCKEVLGGRSEKVVKASAIFHDKKLCCPTIEIVLPRQSTTPNITITITTTTTQQHSALSMARRITIAFLGGS
ncbi:hypothetical protein E2C01_014401 [Portunus trituberculatus]|uniref:Uncharacterized protein n=1 Tax=Portunus trituberculatus TaxID=210409 RepID=A0A5B7DKD3_PORTR|nr:hypothetical protein [Portunus trituberculatus]